MEGGYLTTLNEAISTAAQLVVGQRMDESLWLGLLMGAEAEIRLSL